MKKRLILTSILFCGALFAQAADVQSLVVQPKTGSETVNVLSSVQRITFSGTSFTVVKKDATQSNYTISNVQKLLFALRSATKVEETSKSVLKAYPNPTTEILFVEGISKVESLRLFNLTGLELSVSHTQLIDGLQLNTRALPQGFYLLQVNNQTIKFQKR